MIRRRNQEGFIRISTIPNSEGLRPIIPPGVNLPTGQDFWKMGNTSNWYTYWRRSFIQECTEFTYPERRSNHSWDRTRSVWMTNDNIFARSGFVINVTRQDIYAIPLKDYNDNYYWMISNDFENPRVPAHLKRLRVALRMAMRQVRESSKYYARNEGVHKTSRVPMVLRAPQSMLNEFIFNPPMSFESHYEIKNAEDRIMSNVLMMMQSNYGPVLDEFSIADIMDRNGENVDTDEGSSVAFNDSTDSIWETLPTSGTSTTTTVSTGSTSIDSPF